MAVTIDQAFIRQYESDVKLAYQQGGSKLRNTVRLKTGVKGSQDRFQKVGKGSAVQKPRHGDIPPMNPEHSYVDATLEDWYGGDFVDSLDKLKINIDEQQALIDTSKNALGRKVDNLIIEAANASLPAGYQNTGAYNDYGSASYHNAIQAAVMEGFQSLNSYDVPDDGNRICVLGPHQWNHMLKVEEFSSADYVGPEQLPWLKGTQAKRWMNMLFMMHTGLKTANSAASRICLMYHKSAIGLAEGADVTTDITWQGTKAAWWVNAWISAGAIRIDPEGVWEFYAQDAAMTI